MIDAITKNFARSEFACNGRDCCGKSAPVDVRLVRTLQMLRDRIGFPIKVISGFRCRKHNSKTPNAKPNSYHTLGMAADITCYDLPIAALRDYVVELITELGYGWHELHSAENFVHFDIRNAP